MRNYKKHEDLPIKKKNSKNNSHRQKQNMVTDTTTKKAQHPLFQKQTENSNKNLQSRTKQ
jgi:hypothetical protein